MKEFKSSNNLPFLSAIWDHPLATLLQDSGGPWQVFRIGTIDGQWRCNDGCYEILSFANKMPGNGHLNDVFELFEHSCMQAA